MKTMLNEKFIAKAAKALGDRHRLTILQEIATKGSINMTQAQQLTNLAQPSVSHHVKQLVDSELVEANKEGKMIYISINREKLAEFTACFGNLNLLSGAKN